jgi:hypothetical protein
MDDLCETLMVGNEQAPTMSRPSGGRRTDTHLRQPNINYLEIDEYDESAFNLVQEIEADEAMDETPDTMYHDRQQERATGTTRQAVGAGYAGAPPIARPAATSSMQWVCP